MVLQWRHMDTMVSHNTGNSTVFNLLFRRTSKKTSKPRATSLCEGNPPLTGGLSSQMELHFKTHMRKFFPFDDVIMHYV